MGKTSIILKILIIIISILLILPNNVKAFGLVDSIIETFFEKDDIRIDTDITIGKTDAINSSNGMISVVLRIMQVIGSLASVIALIVIGFRYMFSSLQEKAEMKGVLIYYIIGAVLVFATSNILGIAYDIITGITM